MRALPLLVGTILGTITFALISFLFRRLLSNTRLAILASTIAYVALLVILFALLSLSGPLRVAAIASILALASALLAAIFGYISTQRERQKA